MMQASTGIGAAAAQAVAARSRAPTEAPGAPQAPALDELSAQRRRGMLQAGREVLECRRVLEKGGLNLVGEILRGAGTFYEYEHYPEDDVYDPDTRSQYYYHAHRGGMSGENGHFHTFIRDPQARLGKPPAASAPDAEDIAHLIAVSMDAYGWPIGLFATNRWVTGERWFKADDVIELARDFRIDHAHPSWPVNRWLSAMFVLYAPHIEALLRHRDAVVAAWARDRALDEVLEDRALELTGYLAISVEDWVRALEASLAAPRERS